MLKIFPGEALNSYLGGSWSHCYFLGHGRQDKECQAAGLLPSWPHFTMSALLWKGCPRQCTRDAQPLHPSMGCCVFFFFLAPSNVVMFDRSDLFSCNEPLGKKRDKCSYLSPQILLLGDELCYSAFALTNAPQCISLQMCFLFIFK